MDTAATNYQQCIDECIACAVECRHCGTACLQEDEVKSLAHCIQLNNDCTAVCLFAMNAMISRSEFTKEICRLCATICTACAVECEKNGHFEHCARCAQQCRKCAALCNSM